MKSSRNCSSLAISCSWCDPLTHNTHKHITHKQTHYIIAFFMQIAITQIVIVVKYLICFPLRTNMSCWMIHANTKTKHTQIEREKKLKKQTKEWKERKWTTKCKKNTLGRQEWRRKNRRISWKFFIRNKNVILVYNV